jgi:hypothetical protein
MPPKLGKLFHRREKSQAMPVRQKAQQQLNMLPGEIPKPLMPGFKVQAEEIRELRDLIRKRYALDIEIWDLRDVRPRDRPIVEAKMRRSDAMLQQIYLTICEWDRPDAFHSQRDWIKLQEIKIRIEEGGKRFWAANPPWDEQILVDRSIGVS